jgi:hypothetical protein
VANHHRTEGDPNDLVPVQVKIPLWLKRLVLDDAKANAQDLSEWVRNAMRLALRDKAAVRRVR